MTLVVVPTPIGNLEDITLRALRVLREADLVACEDTRRTGRLLAYHGIKNELLAYHEHNEERIARERSTFVLFESPHRLARTLGELPGETPIAVCRELTKLHEEVFRGTAEEAARRFSERTRGEIVLVVRGGT